MGPGEGSLWFAFLDFRVHAWIPSTLISTSSFLLTLIAILLQPRETALCPPSQPHHSLCHLYLFIRYLFPWIPSSSTPTEISPCFPPQIIPKSYLLQEDILVLLNPSHFLIQIHLLLFGGSMGEKTNWEYFLGGWHWRPHWRESRSKVGQPPSSPRSLFFCHLIQCFILPWARPCIKIGGVGWS